MARILFIGSGSPWQGGAGYLVRQNLFLGALGEVAELHLAMFDSQPGLTPAYVRQLTPLAKPKKVSGGKLKNLIADVVDPMPRMLRGYDRHEAQQQLAALKPADFDAIFAFRIDFACFADVLKFPRLILDIDDPEHVRGYRRLMALDGGGDRRTLRDLEKLRVFERTAVAGAKLAFVCQANDQGGWGKPPEVVPNCVVVPPSPARTVTQPIVIFVGNCATGPTSPNVDAVLFFLSEIWPAISTAIPTAEFHIVGKTSELVKAAAEKTPGAKLLGFVDDLADVYATAAVSVAPIRFGTGTRIKILESFAYACPVVSTLAGAEGIDAIPGKEIELAAGATDFAEHTIALLRDEGHRELIGQGGRALALREYDSAVQQRRLVARFNQFLHAEVPNDRKASE